MTVPQIVLCVVRLRCEKAADLIHGAQEVKCPTSNQSIDC